MRVSRKTIRYLWISWATFVIITFTVAQLLLIHVNASKEMGEAISALFGIFIGLVTSLLGWHTIEHMEME